MTVESTMIIDGKSVVGDDWITVINPAHTSVTIGQFPKGTSDHVDLAVRAAKAALPEWRATPAAGRAALISEASARLAQNFEQWVPLLTQENGKVLAESGLDFMMAVGVYQGWGSHPEWMDDEVITEGRRSILRKEPIGVCAGIVPWNYPQVLAAIQIGTALFAGNTMVLKVPEFGPLALLESLSLLSSIFPPGVLNVVSGFGPEVGRALVQHPDVRKVSFTGSSETGKTVMADASGHLARVTLELGGNDAALVLDDADITDDAVQRIVTGAFLHTGQICFAIKRVFVHESRYEELTKGLESAVGRYVVGDGMNPEVTMGPINNSRQYDKVSAILAETKKTCDTIELGRYADGTDVSEGYYMLPHLVLDPPDEATVVACEQMGPILPIMRFSTDDEAVARANSTEYGLGSSVWSADEERAFSVASRLEAGMTFINSHNMNSMDQELPFGGVKASGMGYAGHKAGLAGYVQLHGITDNFFVPPGH